MKTKTKQFLVTVSIALAVAAFEQHTFRAKHPSLANRRKLLDEISYADAGLSTIAPFSLAPDHSGQTLAYLHLTDSELQNVDTGFVATLLNLKTLQQRDILKTNNIKYAFDWSPDDRYWVFAFVPMPETGQKSGRELLKVYDRNDNSIRGLTDSTYFREQALYWLSNDSFLFALQKTRIGENYSVSTPRMNLAD